jgi:hypothetical protein
MRLRNRKSLNLKKTSPINLEPKVIQSHPHTRNFLIVNFHLKLILKFSLTSFIAALNNVVLARQKH